MSPDTDQPTAPNASTALARTFVDELVRCGLRDVVAGAGSRSTALVLACDAHPKLRVHVCVDERSAGFVAIGVARASRRAAAVVTTSGSAVVNLHPAVVEATHARVPLLLLTADRPPELRHTGANQTIDQVKVFGDNVRWFVEVGAPSDVPGANAHWRSTACQAWARANGTIGVAGPVHANLAFREPTIPASDDGRTATTAFFGNLDGRADDAPWTRVRSAVQRDEVGALALADRLRAARRPLLLVGSADLVPAPVTQLARAAEMPMLAEPLSNARRGASGVAHASLLVAAGLMERPDLVVRVGRPGLSRAIEKWLGPDVPQVLIDADGEFLDPGRAVAEIIVADPEPFCAIAAASLRDRPRTDADAWLATWKDLDAEVAGLLDACFEDDAPTGPSVARALVRDLPENAALVIASSAPIRDVDAHAPLREDLWMVGNRGTSGIDGFVSTALGIALSHDGATVALAGDLSFLHDQGAWLLRPDLPEGADVDLVVVVVDNDGGGLFHHLPVAEQEGFERLFGTPHGLDLGAIAAAHGVGVTVVNETTGVGPAVSAALAAGGRQVVHVRTDRTVEAEQRRAIGKSVAALRPMPGGGR